MQVVSLPYVDTARRADRPRRLTRSIAIPIEDRQLTLFAPAILRRRAVRTRKAIAFRSIDGSRSVHWTVERIEIDNGGGQARTHAADGTFAARGYVGLDSKRYRDDERCQDFVSRHPEGASLSEVAEALNIGKSTADDIEARAFKTLLARARAGDREVRAWFFALAQHIGLDRIAREYDDEDEEGVES